jgi:alpha-1,6-mannosyltransferase
VSNYLGYSSLALVFAAAGAMVWQSTSSFSEHVVLFWGIAALMQIAGLMLWRSRYVLSARKGLIFAVVLQLLGLVGQPMFEDDYFRYLWDGYQSVSSGTPYGKAPEQFFAEEKLPAKMQWVLSGVNNPEVPTIYGPAVQQIFAIAYRIAPGEERALRALFALLHLALVALLLYLPTPRASVPEKKLDRVYAYELVNRHALVVMYVSNPLVFKEVALTGHFDFLLPLALVGAYCALQRSHKVFAGVLVASAVACKVVALLALPLLIWRGQFKLLLGFTLALLCWYLPYGVDSDLLGLAVFAKQWQFNAGAFALLALLGSELAKVLSLMLLMVVLAFCSWRVRADAKQLPKALLWLFATLILLGPVVNPWYWLWLLPIACLVNARWTFCAGTLLLLSYGHGLFLPASMLAPYELPFGLQILEHIGVLLLFAVSFRKKVI